MQVNGKVIGAMRRQEDHLLFTEDLRQVVIRNKRGLEGGLEVQVDRRK